MENKQNSVIYSNTRESFNHYCRPSGKYSTPSELYQKFETIEFLYGKSQSLFDSKTIQISDTIEHCKNLFDKNVQESQQNTDKVFDQISKIQHQNINYTKNLPYKDKQQHKFVLQNTFNQNFIKLSEELIESQHSIHDKLLQNKSKILSFSEQIATTQNKHEQQMSELVRCLDQSVADLQEFLEQLQNDNKDTGFKMQSNYLALTASLDLQIQSEIECGRRDRILIEKLLQKLIHKMTIV